MDYIVFDMFRQAHRHTFGTGKPWRLIQAAAYRPIPPVPYCPVRCGQEYLGLLPRQGSSAQAHTQHQHQHTAPSNLKTKDRTQPVRGPKNFLSETNDVRLAEGQPQEMLLVQPIPANPPPSVYDVPPRFLAVPS
ncbi:hypothetical protein I7I51_08718 [Histoplasma capsulatum]|uniref:Uncharacterized protein n=1 Tax=Ajellomyces capsulatus TaxID=5037 RepID=A0A8A1M136_AJECA|nr:hypothetical protein I7I51_08718 [Histoplasma capsulatum]